LVAVIASYLQSRSREWHPSGRPRRTYTLLLSENLHWIVTIILNLIALFPQNEVPLLLYFYIMLMTSL